MIEMFIMLKNIASHFNKKNYSTSNTHYFSYTKRNVSFFPQKNKTMLNLITLYYNLSKQTINKN